MSGLTASREDILIDQIVRQTGRRVIGLAVDCKDDVVVLRGSATSFHVKQLAQHAARAVFPGVAIRNAIRVEPRTGS